MNHQQEDYVWIMRVLNGCFTKFHVDCCDSIIELFKVKHPKEIELYNLLRQMMANKNFEINSLKDINS